MLPVKPGHQGPLDDADILPNIIRADHSGHIRTSRSRTDDLESDSELVDSPSGYETESTSPSEGSAGEDMGVRAAPGSQRLKQVRKSNLIYVPLTDKTRIKSIYVIRMHENLASMELFPVKLQ